MKVRLFSVLFACCLFVQVSSLVGATSTNWGGDFTHVARKATPAVVSIRVEAKAKANAHTTYQDLFGSDIFERFFGIPREQQAPVIGQGSGFIVSEDGHVLTNSHVVDGAERITVILKGGEELDATLIGQDAGTDLAVLKLERKNLPFLEFADSSELEPGEWAVAIGNPLGLQTSLTTGVISATGRNNLSLAQVEDFIQTDAAINRGNSGGPLLNMDGKVIGVNTAIASNTGGYMGIGFAIPSNIAHHILEQILDKGGVSRGYIGIAMQPIDKGLAKAFGLTSTNGALVASVMKDSPAEKAGLQQGDIILKIDNKEFDGIGGIRNEVALKDPGTEVVLQVLRKEKELDVPVSIGTYPGTDGTVLKGARRLGLELEELSPELAERLGHTDEVGLYVSKVDPSSPAYRAGIRKGAIVLGINQQAIYTIQDFEQVMSQVEDKGAVLLLVKQGRSPRFLTLPTR